MENVLIVGAGAAGLAAAEELSSRGIPVTVLEAKDRAGGRIHTILHAGQAPIELGAEFIHGRRNDVWPVVAAARLPVQEVPDRHWEWTPNGLSESRQFWDELEKAGESLPRSGPDRDVRSRLAWNSKLDDHARRLMLEFVEGFHAAPADRIGIKAVIQANEASDRDEGRRAFRIQAGYSAVIDWFIAQLANRNATIHLNAPVKTIRWEEGAVEATTRTRDGEAPFRATCCLITLPLGVLKCADGTGVEFDPALEQKDQAIRGLGMGHVVKVMLRFRERFWPADRFGFIHSNHRSLPTWWAHDRGAMLTGWAGGPRAEALSRAGEETIFDQAIRAVGRLFGMETSRVRDLIAGRYYHDWSKDPFSRGAYSFTPVGMMEMPRRLAEPIAETLFFAGEATDATGEQGTVHAAIASGQRAAREIIQCLQRTRRAAT